MRMFVFRDVPLDTYFEPKTRKEISKISWYNLRDLPGFVRKNRNEADSGNTNKFYMVAPFMSHVKKWIGQQRRKDEAIVHTEEELVAHGLDAQQAIGEQSEYYPEPMAAPLPPVDRSEELKRLLSIGGPSAMQAPQAPAQPQASQANHLLAMLQGGAPSQQNSGPPQTPMDQVNAFMPVQPESPHPRHPRQAPMGYQQPPPQFPLSPPRVPQQNPLGNLPYPPPGFGQQQTNNGNYGPSTLPHQQAFFQQAQNATGIPSGQPHPQPNGHFNHPQMHAQHPQLAQQSQPPSQTPVPGQYQVQGQHGAIASGPSAPNASQLPPPRLSAQSMKLLDAFKTGQKPAQPYTNFSGAQRSGSAHQSALLGLFKSSPAPEAAQAPHDPRSEQAIVSPGPDEYVQKPAALQERRPTLNEITRSLPVNFKPKRPSQLSPAIPTQMSTGPTQAPQPPANMAEQPIPTHGYELEPQQTTAQVPSVPAPQRSPANVPRTRPANVPKEPKPKDAPASSAKQIMQRTGSRQTPGRAPRDKSGTSPSPARQSKPKAGEVPAPMTILARPGSSRGKSGSPASDSKQTFQPQLLKRNEGTDTGAAPASNPSDTNEGAANGDGSGKRDQLLALFSKSPAVAPTPPQASPDPAPTPPPAVVSPTSQAPAPTTSHNNNLLNLFNSTAPTQQPSPQPSPAPPSAPSLQPAQRPAKPRTPAPPPIISHPPQQNSLLDLFKKAPGHAASPSIESPISPFNLSSPQAMRHPSGEAQKSRLGSVTSADSRRGSGNAAASGRGSGGATPTEQKDFLLGFLNGVVQKEGHKK